MHKEQLRLSLLLLSLGLWGCERKPEFDPSYRQPTHDAQGFLVQPSETNVASANTTQASRLFIQFHVDGREEAPFILCLNPTILADDVWPSSKPKTYSTSVFVFSRLGENPPRPYAFASMKPENIVAIEDAIKKSSDWAQVAIKENIDVQSKRLLEFTNEQVFVDFKRLKDSTNFFLTISVRESKAVSMNSFPMLWSAILDERGAERMLSVLTNLTSRRRRYLAFREEDARTEAQRREAEAKEKTRADTLLR